MMASDHQTMILYDPKKYFDHKDLDVINKTTQKPVKILSNYIKKFGQEESSVRQEDGLLRQEECHLGQEECLLGQEERGLGQEESRLGQEECVLGQEGCLLGKEECLLGQEECLLGQEQGTIVIVSHHQIMILYDQITSSDHQELDFINENG